MRKLIGRTLFAFLLAFPAFGQETRTEEIEQAKTAKAAMVHAQDREKGDVIITRLEHIFMPATPAFSPTAGDFRQGAGFPLGVAFTMPAMRSGLWKTEAAWSTNNSNKLTPWWNSLRWRADISTSLAMPNGTTLRS